MRNPFRSRTKGLIVGNGFFLSTDRINRNHRATLKALDQEYRTATDDDERTEIRGRILSFLDQMNRDEST